MDSDFIGVGYSARDWQDVIDEFYNKYGGIRKWHSWLLSTVKEQGYIEVPSGRYYRFDPDFKKRYPWPLTQIKNYPVN